MVKKEQGKVKVINVYSEEYFKKAPEELRNEVNKLIVMWKMIKDLPYERKKVRYILLVIPFRFLLGAKACELHPKKIFAFDENSFRKEGLRVSGNTIFMGEEPFGYLVDIVDGEEFIKNTKYSGLKITVDLEHKYVSEYVKELNDYTHKTKKE
ncbi:hypothetical protein ES695_00235 [Candidatus Atribacteria bacterium 1244-E10-H5-B2]|nr:MAG: hypothetical protein ES695_00235 [Candidatus Atribacteria bacterium 1244-E10-H5-B2]